MFRGEHRKIISLLLSYIMVVSLLSGFALVKAASKGRILIDFRHGEWDGIHTDHYILPYSIAELLSDDEYAGYTVDENYDKWLNEIELSVYDALLIVSPWGWGLDHDGFLSEELNAITNYVQNGGGLLLTVDTQMYYGNNVPNQVAGLFGVSFFGDFVNNEIIVNFEHPITIDKKQEDLFNPFLLYDAAIQTYPSDAVTLVDVLDRGSSSNSSLSGALRASESSGSTVYPAMIALEFGNGRAVFGPANGLTQPWGTAHYNRGEPNKMLLNTIEWLVREGIPQEILDEEDELYKASKAAVEYINENMGEMIQITAKDLSKDVMNLAVGLYIHSDIDTDVDPNGAAAEKALLGFEMKLIDVAGDPYADRITIMLRYLTTKDGLKNLDAIELKHSEFIGTRIVRDPDADVSVIKSDIGGVKSLIDNIPIFVKEFRYRFNEIESWKQTGRDVDTVLLIGGIMLTACSFVTGGATAPLAYFMLTNPRQIVKIVLIGLSLGEAISIAYKFGETYEKESKIVNIYTRELDRIIVALETGELPQPSAAITDVKLDEKVKLASISSFSGTVENTCSVEEDARLIVKIITSNNDIIGPFYSKIITVNPG